MNEEDAKKIRKEERDNFTIVLEELRSDFRMFGEALSHVREKGDATFEEVGKIKIEITEIKGEIGEMKGDIVEMKGDIVEMKGEIVEMKGEIGEMKGEIGEMKGEIGEMNGRLDNIEFEVKSLRKDFDLMREEMKEKMGAEYAEKIEERIVRIEKHLELAV